MKDKPFQCLHKFVGGVEKVFQAPGDRLLPAVVLHLGGVCEGDEAMKELRTFS